MKKKVRLKITVIDERRLQTLGSVKVNGWKLAATVLAFLIFSIGLGALIIMISPLKLLLPGYMSRKERIETETMMMRVDSLADADARTRLYLENLLTVTNTDRIPSDSLKASRGRMAAGSDSLMDAAPGERKFVEMMREREKFNISVLAPLAADGMIFSTPVTDGVISPESVEQHVARYILPASSAVCAIADGRVISVSKMQNGRSEIIVQHINGFLSRLSGIAEPVVSPGSHVSAGQVIGMPPGRLGSGTLELEIWRDGDVLVPSQYVRGELNIPLEPSTLSGEPMGR